VKRVNEVLAPSFQIPTCPVRLTRYHSGDKPSPIIPSSDHPVCHRSPSFEVSARGPNPSWLPQNRLGASSLLLGELAARPFLLPSQRQRRWTCPIRFIVSRPILQEERPPPQGHRTRHPRRVRCLTIFKLETLK